MVPSRPGILGMGKAHIPLVFEWCILIMVQRNTRGYDWDTLEFTFSESLFYAWSIPSNLPWNSMGTHWYGWWSQGTQNKLTMTTKSVGRAGTQMWIQTLALGYLPVLAFLLMGHLRVGCESSQNTLFSSQKQSYFLRSFLPPECHWKLLITR